MYDTNEPNPAISSRAVGGRCPRLKLLRVSDAIAVEIMRAKSLPRREIRIEARILEIYSGQELKTCCLRS